LICLKIGYKTLEFETKILQPLESYSTSPCSVIAVSDHSFYVKSQYFNNLVAELVMNNNFEAIGEKTKLSYDILVVSKNNGDPADWTDYPLISPPNYFNTVGQFESSIKGEIEYINAEDVEHIFEIVVAGVKLHIKTLLSVSAMVITEIYVVGDEGNKALVINEEYFGIFNFDKYTEMISLYAQPSAIDQVNTFKNFNSEAIEIKMLKML